MLMLLDDDHHYLPHAIGGPWAQSPWGPTGWRSPDSKRHNRELGIEKNGDKKLVCGK